MARQRKLTEERRSLINQLLATYKPEASIEDQVLSMYAKGMTTRDIIIQISLSVYCSGSYRK